MSELKTLAYSEHIEKLKSELKENGLHLSIKKRCDSINNECYGMNYIVHREIQELLCEILELIKIEVGGEQ